MKPGGAVLIIFIKSSREAVAAYCLPADGSSFVYGGGRGGLFVCAYPYFCLKHLSFICRLAHEQRSVSLFKCSSIPTGAVLSIELLPAQRCHFSGWMFSTPGRKDLFLARQGESFGSTLLKKTRMTLDCLTYCTPLLRCPYGLAFLIL